MPYRDSRTKRPEKGAGHRPAAAADTTDESFVIGRNPVKELLKSGRTVDTVYMDTALGGSLTQISRIAKESGTIVKDVKSEKLTRMCGSPDHQGVIAAAACAEYVSVEDILAVSAEKGTPPLIIICDEIEDPHNLGAIIRTAEAAGADGIIIPKRRSASLNMTVHRTSAGAASYLPAARVSNIPQTIDMLKERGIWIYGTQADAPSYTDTDLTGPAAIVIGSEGYGMSRLVREKCDVLVSLPMFGKINSLNASVAAGIFIYEAVRQRIKKQKTD